ncbi:DegT/DnrJ/EryC1/StrS family aminotransferase [Dyadobacter frigoris]|uniref:GDP-perosamine synthase n=1 Tax=Dyadobacter frigoris TaxID=2576211 RepID=A0A4U6D1Y0_9BACT|nr:aminotransferase class I/II-fold pyridoxal phosphate-dependent enzyme [Dyadobacter frigoris]TKT91152.1 aminotransferase class I/II-fold pyridoxal phosphate-dependent enzyme [Dyadobacter frigoris]GLU55080.1 pyridoxal phosphate-dependent aminotransferase [Dyadobacter frigoris]
MKKIWLSPPHMSGKELKYIQEAFDSNWIAPLGPNVDAFEQELANYVGLNNAVALSSGTSALHLALIMAGVGPGDIVICPTFTFAASANPIVYLKATPVFIDSENLTWNLCPDILEKTIKHYIKKGKKPKAIIGVHIYGMPMQLNETLLLCEKYEIPFIEDAAEALGSSYNGKKLGSFGKISIISFNGNKIITTSGGGALLSNDPIIIKKAKFLASQAKDDAPYYQHSEIGYNYRLSNICAGIGKAQLEVIDNRVKSRRANFDFYRKELGSLSGISFQNEPPDFFSNRWLTCILIDPKLSEGVNPDKIRLHLEAKNIESRHLWKPLHLQPVFKDVPYFGGNVAEGLFERGLCLPSGSSLSEEDLLFICENIKSLFHKS